MGKVLVLNQDYSALSVCTVPKAFLLVYMNKAELLAESPTHFLRTVRDQYPMPVVIRLNHYIHLPYRGVVMTRHTLSVLVENKSGVLARVSALFSRRGFNIESLAVGPTENPDLSRMTIVVDVEAQPLEQITKQLNKLIEVIKIVELDGASVQRELLLVKVRAPLADRVTVLQTAELFRARVIDVNVDTVTLEATGTPDKLQALVAVLAPLGIKEMAQSGTVALGRGPRSMSGAGTLRQVDQRSA